MKKYFVVTFLFTQLFAFNGYLYQNEVSGCQDECSQYYIESEVDGGFDIVPIFFQDSNVNIELYLNRFVEIDLGQEVNCVECSAFEVLEIQLSADCEFVVNCFQNPCSLADACGINECEANYCGGCNADFYDLDGDLVDCSLTTENNIEGRWHLVDYEDNVMYQFEDNYRYSIYSEDGTFGSIEEGGGSPNPYTVVEDIITIDLFFGNIVNYQMDYICDGQAVEFRVIEDGAIHSKLSREGYNYIDNECEEPSEECFDFTSLDFGQCTMVLGVGYIDSECSYVSGCGWILNGIDYSDVFYDSMESCDEACDSGGLIDVGDINGDGGLNILDIVIMINMILDDEYDVIADLNEDNNVNILDVVRLVNIILDTSDTNTAVDIDGNVYSTVQIGDQLWMKENLKVTHYNNGDEIPISGFEWAGLQIGAYAVYSADEDTISQTTCGDDCADVYGNLYNWFTVEDERGVCPEGWHIPSDSEYMELEMFLGMSESEANSTGSRGANEGSKLAGRGDLWNIGNLEENTVFGTSDFSGLPAGSRDYGNGNYNSMSFFGAFWSSTESNSLNAWNRELEYHSSVVYRFIATKQFGFSIRCLNN